MALVDVIRAGQLGRLRTCESDDLRQRASIDLSKNRSRRYCDAGCGNRANVAAYRARKARMSDASPPGDRTAACRRLG